MEQEQIETRARDYAQTYILMCLLGWRKRTDPAFVSEIGRSFDEYIGKHELSGDDGFKQQILVAARTYLRGIIEDEAITVQMKR